MALVAGGGQRRSPLVTAGKEPVPTRKPVSTLQILDETEPPLNFYGAVGRLGAWVERRGRGLVILLPYLWLLVFFFVPFLIVLKLSFSEAVLALPPYKPLFEMFDDAGFSYLKIQLNLSNYGLLLEDGLYWRAYANSLQIAAVSTLIALGIGLPMAYSIVRAPSRWRFVLIMMVILPFWTSFLIRVYAWIGILKNEGLLNAVLLGLGVIDQPLVILNTNIAVYVGIVYSYLPFMVLPVYASFEKMEGSLVEAAVDLGCHPMKTFWVVTLPMAWPGIVAGCLLVFIPAVGEFVIPDLLGGSETLMIGRTLWVEFFNNRDWPLASAVAMVMLVVLVIPIILFERALSRRRAAEAG